MARGYDIRRARPDEFDACAALYVAVLRETFTWQPPERHQAEAFLATTGDEEIYVAVKGGRIVGLAGFYRPQNFIHSLYVTERGRGVGKALLDHLQSVADGPMSLKVQTPNLRAQAFYAREGFACVEEGSDADSDVRWRRLLRRGP